MIDFCYAMGLILTAWMLALSALVAVGRTVLRRLDGEPLDARRAFAAFWLGLTLLVLFLQAWHLVQPIGNTAALVVLAAAAVALGFTGLELARWLYLGVRRHPFAALALLLSALWIANQAIGPTDAHDSGLYHLPIIRWNKTYAAVPGLGNLSPAFAINNAVLLITALQDHGPWAGRAAHITNGMFLLVLAATCIHGWSRFPLALREPAQRVPILFACLLAPLALGLLFSKEVTSPKTDLSAAVVAIALCHALVWMPIDAVRGRPIAPSFITAAALAGLAACFKLSAAAFAALAVLLACYYARAAVRPRHFATAASLIGLLAAGYVARNAVTSGYPAYPSGALALPVDWRVPDDRRSDLVLAITGHPKATLPNFVHANIAKAAPLRPYAQLAAVYVGHERDVAGLAWVAGWVLTAPGHSSVEVLLPLAVIGLFTPSTLLARRRSPSPAAPEAWVALPLAVAVALWFVQAPDPRYVYGFTWSAAGLALGLWARHTSLRPRRLAIAAVGLILGLSLAVVGYRAAMLVVLRESNPLAQIPFRRPGPDRGFHPTPVAELTTWRSRWGTELLVSTNPNGLIWNAPLPAVGWPPPDPNLELRNPTVLAAGFRSNVGEMVR